MRMSKEEMDDAHTTKLRQEVLEKSRKRVVLDDEAAAKFSTAANKAMANKELRVRLCSLAAQQFLLPPPFSTRIPLGESPLQLYKVFALASILCSCVCLETLAIQLEGPNSPSLPF